MNYRERMKEYLKEPNEYSGQYGKWGILNREQRNLIKRLLTEMDSADDAVMQQYFEIERLNKQIEKYQKALDETTSENIDLHSIIKEVRKIFKYYGDRGDIENYSTYFITGEALIRIYEILDKENK